MRGGWPTVGAYHAPPWDFYAPAGEDLANAAGAPRAEHPRDIAISDDGAPRHLVDEHQNPLGESGGRSRRSTTAALGICAQARALLGHVGCFLKSRLIGKRFLLRSGHYLQMVDLVTGNSPFSAIMPRAF